MRAFVFLVFLTVFSRFIGEEIIPVVFIHKTNSDYLVDSLWQASQFNKKVVLIGDESNKSQGNCDHYLISDYSVSANALASIYKHQSTNSPEYELFCIQRWFVLKEFMEKNNFNVVFHCDSDVMLYCDVLKEYKKYSPRDLLIGYWRTSASGHCSYFTYEQIQKFCDYVMSFYWDFDSYKDRIELVSDMFILAEYVKEESVRVCDLMILPKKGGVFDLNIASPHGGYEMNQGLKAIQWINGLPYCYNSEIGRKIRFKSLHFQGLKRKLLMKEYRAVNVP